jgi:glycosyltransferase involved in cell wall biosynthesis
MKKVKVSVCIVTYNHIKFIDQCLESLVNQETNFDFEILVSDDCSTDGTRDVLAKYEKLYPNLVKPFFQSKNLGAQKNFIFVHQKAQGEYIAHVDGDDYALPGKLQFQAQYLDENPDCNIVWHRMTTLKNDQFYNDNYLASGIVFKKLDIIDLIANITLGMNSSKMYRNDFENKDLIDYYDLDFSFNALKLLNTNKYAAFSSELVHGVYRSGIGISVTHNYKIKIKIYEWLLRFYKDKLVDRSFINAKILLLVLSDIKHLDKTVFYGVYAFFVTSINFKIKSVRFMHSKNRRLINMFEMVNNKL